MGRDINQCHPELQKKAAEFVSKAKASGYTIKITECFRSVAEQDALYAQGRTTAGSIITNAKGSSYSSMHQWGVAFDICRNDGQGAYNNDDDFFYNVGAIGQSIGLEWGGSWTSFQDLPHYQLPNWGSTPSKLKSTYGSPEEFMKTWGSNTLPTYIMEGPSLVEVTPSSNTSSAPVNSSTMTVRKISDSPLVDGNSSLASYTNRIAPNSFAAVRTSLISCITVHIAKSTGNLDKLAALMNSSSTTYNYGIDSDGQIGLFVDEPYPSNASGNSANDQRSVNIVCMNTSLSPRYEISNLCFDSLVDLCEDICRRNFIFELKLNKKKPEEGTLTLHSQFQEDSSCPGPYLESKLDELQKVVSERLAKASRVRVSVNSWQADSELAALRAQSTVSLGAIKPYVARITNDEIKVNYKSLQDMGVVGFMFNGGVKFNSNKPGHSEYKQIATAKLYDQMKYFQDSGVNLPFGLYYTSRALNLAEVKSECDDFYYTLSKYKPKLGAWLNCDFYLSQVKPELSAIFVDYYYQQFVKWGFKSKCGIMASKKQAENFGWPNQASYMPLWLTGEIDNNVAAKDEVLTPSYFKLDDLKNKGYNEARDKQSVIDYAKSLRTRLAQYSSYVPVAGATPITGVGTGGVPSTVEKQNTGTYTEVKVPQIPQYLGAKTVESRTSVGDRWGQGQMKNHPNRTFDDKGFCMWDGRYGVAVGTAVCGTVGTFIDVVLENGTIIPCIMFDQKSDQHTDDTYHMFTVVNNAYCCSEFTIERAMYYEQGGTGNASSSHPGWNSKVVAFRVYSTNYLSD